MAGVRLWSRPGGIMAGLGGNRTMRMGLDMFGRAIITAGMPTGIVDGGTEQDAPQRT